MAQRRSTFALAWLAAVGMGNGRADAQEPARVVRADTAELGGRLREHVAFLAAPQMKGRPTGSPENRAAGAWIAAKFAALGLEPLPERGWFHDFELGAAAGRNVVGILRAPNASAGCIVVGAHYDGQIPARGVVRPSAGDNAAGVAVLLETARALGAVDREAWACDVVFVAFDAEEGDGVREPPQTRALNGSAAFVDEGIVEIESIRLALILDTIGAPFFPWETAIYATGGEHCDAVRRAVDAQELVASEVRQVGTYVLEPLGPLLARSDYQAFRAENVPFLFLSRGTPWNYHTQWDVPERLDVAGLADVARLTIGVTGAIAASPEPLEYIAKPEPVLADLEGMAALVAGILERRDEIDLDAKLAQRLQKAQDAMATAIERGTMGKRGGRLAQRVLIDVFAASARSWRAMLARERR